MKTTQESLILEVKLKENGDYDRENIQFTSDYSWTEEDKKKIKDIINHEFFNSSDISGEQKAITSVGEVMLRHKEHPQVPRRKLIQGFIEQKISPSFHVCELMVILKTSIPETIKNNQEAIKYLDILDMLVNNYDKNGDDPKYLLFDSILRILEEHKDKYTENEGAAERLSKVVDNLRKLATICKN
jgi:hypothetical protein